MHNVSGNHGLSIYLSLTLLVFAYVKLYGEIRLSVPTNRVVEWELISEKEYENPFREVSVTATITNNENGNTVTIPAFWAGDGRWKFRFSSPVQGFYEFKTTCNDKNNQGLNGLTGTIHVTKNSEDNPVYLHGPLKVSPNGEYLTHSDDTPFFWLADSWWHGMTSRFSYPDDFLKLAIDRKEKGFSVIQFAISFPCDIEPFDPRGRNEAGDPWDQDFQSINPSYFDLVDQRIEALCELGFIPNIVGLWGYYMKWMDVENVNSHWEYLIARYGAYPVVFTLSGETTLAYYTDLEKNWDYYKDQFRKKWSEVAAFIQNNDPYNRVLTTHPGPGIHDGKPPIYNMELLDMIMLQSGHKGFLTLPSSNQFIQDYRKRFPEIPIIHGEVCFEGMFGSSRDDVQRMLFWSNVLQGTPGFSYGVEGIWQFNTEKEPFGESPTGMTWGNVPWSEAMHYKGSSQLGMGAEFLRELQWWKIKPSPERLSYHAEIENYYDPYAAEIGDDLLIYFTKVGYKPNKLKVLGLSPDSHYVFIYFDPITGKRYSEKTFESSENGEWTIGTPPIMQDWVLLIQSAN